MPLIGETKTDREIGRRVQVGQKYIWAKCQSCGKERWTRFYVKTKDYPLICRSCAARAPKIFKLGDKSPRWKGGKYTDKQGYIRVYIEKDDFFYQMANHNGYIPEHRLVMAKHLGRNLQRWEVIHHKNGIKDDNRIENFELTTKGSHSLAHSKGYTDGYQQGYLDGINLSKGSKKYHRLSIRRRYGF